MLTTRNITLVYFVCLWFLYNTNLVDPVFFWIAVPAWIILPVTASFCICFNLYLKAICRGDKNINHISLSFNLTESNEKWSRINDILNKYKIPAIFFVSGTAVESQPELIAKLARCGHLIGNHSYSKRFGFQSAKSLLTEWDNTEEMIYEATGKDIQYFRPPHGITNPAVRKASEVIGYTVIGWSKKLKIAENSNQPIPVSGIRNGSIIRVDISGSHIPDSFEKFLISLKENFSIVPLNELINPGIENHPIMQKA